MGRRSRTRALGLWMNGAFVGTWSIQPHMGEALQYDHGWVASEQGRPLSLSLPFTPGNHPHRGEAVRAYFENLLPDSKAIRERVARRFRTGSTDAFTLLAEVGRDCVGALQILPDGVAPAGPPSGGSVVCAGRAKLRSHFFDNQNLLAKHICDFYGNHERALFHE